MVLTMFKMFIFCLIFPHFYDSHSFYSFLPVEKIMNILYSLPHSPYSSRCRIAIYYKKLDIDIQAPPGGLRSENYRAIVPTKKVPTLVTQHATLVESSSILEYLEDCFPEIPLRASTTTARAAQRSLISFLDFSIAPQIFPLFKAVMVNADPESLHSTMSTLQKNLKALEELFNREGRDQNELDMADCALIPSLFYALLLLEKMSLEPLFSETPTLQSWWSHRSHIPAVSKVLIEIENGLHLFLQSLAKKRS